MSVKQYSISRSRSATPILNVSPADSAELTTAYLAGTYNGKYVRVTSVDDLVVTIPATTAKIPEGTETTFRSVGAGKVTVAADGSTLNTDDGLSTGGQHGTMMVKKVDTAVYDVIGGVS